MQETERQAALAEIRSLREQGLLTPQQAYERHMLLLSPPPAAPAPTLPPAQKPQPSGGAMPALQLLAVTLAIVGGVFGVIGAIFQELQAGGGILLAFGAAPIIEEALKPAGIYILLLSWPQALLGRLHTAALTALSGLCFGLIESYVYVHVYYRGGDADYRLFRYTVPVAMHVLACFVVGLGLNRGVIDWAAGRGKFPKTARNHYLAGVLLHAAYNITAAVLAVAGVLDFGR